MDREIPKEVRRKERNKKWIRYGIMAASGIVVISVLISLMRTAPPFFRKRGSIQRSLEGTRTL